MTTEAVETLHQDLRGLLGHVLAERYRVDELIGIGGMGAVFRGHHLGLKRDVAIKVLHPDLVRDASISARFDREAQSASRLDHPNCLQVTDYGSTPEGTKYMVMQLLEGVELGTILGKPIEPLRAIDLMIQIVRGLEHAHEQGVVHRDLKPENVFLTRDHEDREILKLVDFGIAKIISGDESEDRMTKVGLVFGTPQYMSPEQATGMEIDGRTDLYSAGIIFHQMLAGALPFQSDDPVALVRMQVSSDPPTLPADVPRPIADVVTKLLQKHRDERYQSARDVREELERIRLELSDAVGVPIVRTFSGSLRAIETIAKVRKRSRVRRRLVISTFGVAGAAAAAWFLLGRAPSTDGPGRGPAEPLTAVAEASDTMRSGPSEEQLAEIDRLLLANHLDDATKVLHPLRDQFPDDAQLLWRQGKLLAKQKRKRSQALAAYGDAIDRNPELLQDRDFYAELLELLRDPKLQDEALDLALRKMGKHGHKFLLEQVNRDKKALDYPSRHRALDALRSDPSSAALIDEKLNLALDLWQAQQSIAPCRGYSDAMAAIESNPDPYFTGAVDKAPMPTPLQTDGVVDEDDRKLCEGLPQRRDELLAALRKLGPDPAAATAADATSEPAPSEDDADAKKAASKPAPKSSSSSAKKKKGRDCSKFGAVFDPKCR